MSYEYIVLRIALLDKPLLIHLGQVEAIEERMSQLRGELAAKEEHLTQASICSNPSQAKRRHPANNTRDVHKIFLPFLIRMNL